MRIARILDSGRKRRSADLTPMVQALFFLVRDLGAASSLRSSCLIRTDVASSKERGSSILYICICIYVYVRSSCGRSPQERISRPEGPIQVFSSAVVLANRPISGANRVLARHTGFGSARCRLKTWLKPVSWNARPSCSVDEGSNISPSPGMLWKAWWRSSQAQSPEAFRS